MTRVDVYQGDSREILKVMATASVDAVVCDPPYALVSIVKRFGGDGAAPTRDGDVYSRSSAGFMGKRWDTGETAFAVEFWREVRRVLKPGGHVVAFSGTRTYHRLAVAIEDAGFEIRDMVAWLYGSGFPKSHDAGDGWGTALKPALEPVCLARKPLDGTVAANVLAHGCGALNIDGCRVATDESTRRDTGTAALWRHSGRVVGGSDEGRWPANVIHDGSDEVLAAFPEAPGALRPVTGAERAHRTVKAYGDFGRSDAGAAPRGDSGSAARFFYSAKADATDRLGSEHPTVKPVDVMAWLIRLVTPPGGVVLDPFAGSGTTGLAALREGRDAILIEREPDHAEDIRRRLAWARGDAGLTGQEKGRAKLAKDPAKAMGAGMPLFGGEES